MSWDPATYLTFNDDRTRPAHDLLARVPSDAPHRVTDLGCGTGNSTALLAARWPGAVIAGVDTSNAMLEKARASGVAATWHTGDIAQWRADAPQDVIFSNAAIHWVDDHADVLPRLLHQLAPAGVLAVQMPRNFAAPSHTLLRETIEETIEETGNAALIDRLRPDPVAPSDTYYAMLAPHAAHLDIWETTYLHVLEGEDAVFTWTSGTALVPFTSAVEGEARAQLIDSYRRKLARAYPQHPDGTTLFAFTRIFIVAARR